MRYVFICLAAAALISLLTSESHVRAAQNDGTRLRTLELGSEYHCFAWNYHDDGLAALDVRRGVAAFFSAAWLAGDQSAKPVTLALKGNPTSIIYKRYRQRGVLIVGSESEGIYLIDAAEFKVLAKATGMRDISALYASANENDPFVYFRTGDGDAGEICALHLGTRKIKEELYSFVGPVAVANDGKQFFRRRPDSPGTLTVAELMPAKDREPPNFEDRGELVWQRHRRLRDSLPAVLLPDPQGELLAADRFILRGDLAGDPLMGELEFDPFCFYPERPLIVGLNEKELAVASYNTLKTIGKVALPKEFVPDPFRRLAKRFGHNLDDEELDANDEELAEYRRLEVEQFMSRFSPRERFEFLWDDIQVFPRPKRNDILIAYNDKVLLVPLAALSLPEEPFLIVKHPAHQMVEWNKPELIRLAKVDPRAKIALVRAPEGMKLTAAGLEWTPREDQLGEHLVEIKVHHENASRTQTLVVEATYPAVRLPFAPHHVAVSRDGKRAICWTMPNEYDPRFRRSEFRQEFGSRVAVVDLPSKTVLASARWTEGVTSADIDGEHVYLYGEQAEKLSLLSHRLERVGEVRFPRESGFTEVYAGDGKSVLLASEFGFGSVRLSVPDLQRLPTPTALTLHNPPARNDYEPRRKLPIRRLGKRWLAGGVVLNEEMNEPLLVHRLFTTFDQHAGAAQKFESHLRDFEEKIDRMLGVMRGEYLRDPKGFAFIDNSLVVACFLNREGYARDEDFSIPKPVTATLAWLDNRGDILHEVTLGKRLDANREPLDWRASCTAVDSTAVVTFDELLFVVPTNWEAMRDYRPPLRFEPRQSTFLLPADAPLVLKHRMESGSPPYQFEIAPQDGLRLDAATGDLTANGKELLAAAEDALARAAAIEVTHSYGSRGAADVVSNLTARAAIEFEMLAGRKPRGVPVGVPIEIHAVDAESQTASLGYFMIGEIPVERLLEKVERAVAEAKERGNEGSPANVDERVATLEKKAELLEAKAKAMIRILDRLKDRAHDASDDEEEDGEDDDRERPRDPGHPDNLHDESVDPTKNRTIDRGADVHSDEANDGKTGNDVYNFDLEELE